MNNKIKECVICGKNILAANKKKICGAIVICAVVGAASAGAHAMFKVSGVVTAVNSNQLSVANFLRTQTVDLAGAPVNTSNIKIGDRVNIQKNLQGQVLYLRIDHHDGDKRDRKHSEESNDRRDDDRRGWKSDIKRIFSERTDGEKRERSYDEERNGRYDNDKKDQSSSERTERNGNDKGTAEQPAGRSINDTNPASKQ